MNIIETTVPISIENLKKYFENKEINFHIDYDNSVLKEEKFLTYLSNLDVPCDVNLNIENEEHQKLISIYMHMQNLVDITSFEEEVLCICLQAAGVVEVQKEYENFMEKNSQIINHWLQIFRSLSVYNSYIIKEESIKKTCREKFENIKSEGVGNNFVNLLKYKNCDLLYFYNEDEKLYFYEDLFEEYMFSGKNLFSFYANKNNKLFLLTWASTNGILEKFIEEMGESDDTSV